MLENDVIWIFALGGMAMICFVFAIRAILKLDAEAMNEDALLRGIVKHMSYEPPVPQWKARRLKRRRRNVKAKNEEV